MLVESYYMYMLTTESIALFPMYSKRLIGGGWSVGRLHNSFCLGLLQELARAPNHVSRMHSIRSTRNGLWKWKHVEEGIFTAQVCTFIGAQTPSDTRILPAKWR